MTYLCLSNRADKEGPVQKHGWQDIHRWAKKTLQDQTEKDTVISMLKLFKRNYFRVLSYNAIVFSPYQQFFGTRVVGWDLISTSFGTCVGLVARRKTSCVVGRSSLTRAGSRTKSGT